MTRFLTTIWIVLHVALFLKSTAEAGAGNYEPTHPPHIAEVTAEAKSFYIEFRARNETSGFGHSFVVLGTIDAIGHLRETIVIGFMPKKVDDDYWSQFGVPVAGSVGVTRSDLVQRPDVRFRLTISRAKYYLVAKSIPRLRNNWTTYELLVHNCNNFVNQIAQSIGLRTPMITAQYPVDYLSELQTLNSR
jgi:hypothetical protein